jgi:hypothetical protein
MNDAQSPLLSRYQPRQVLIDGEILALPADLGALNRGKAAGAGFAQQLAVEPAFGEALFERRCLADRQGYRGLLCRLPLDRRQDRGGAGGAGSVGDR